jgi:hypothetical protein
MRNEKQVGRFIEHPDLRRLGIDLNMIRGAMEYTYKVLDALDSTLILADEPRMAQLLELANLSAIIGNLFRGGFAHASNGRFAANGPHKYPDLISNDKLYGDVEIKVALENNRPKGHLVKPGPHITVRYVLGDDQGACLRGKENRGTVVWFWEVRVGMLNENHFSVSNTAGDSGKTAVFNTDGMAALKVAFLDVDRSPVLPKKRPAVDHSSLL